MRGLRARGGFEVDLSWRDGQLTTVAIKSLDGAPTEVRYGDQSLPLELGLGEMVRLDAELQPMLE